MDTPKTDNRPLAAAIACFTLWGFYPLLFQWTAWLGATPLETLGWRAVTSVVFAAWLVAAAGKGGVFMALLTEPRRLAPYLASGLFIGLNWGLYIWAVSNHHTLSASLGYYINPLLNMAVAAVAFRERIDRYGKAAIALAAVGVVVQTAALGQVPWVALVLAASFCCYGVVRKLASADGHVGLMVECLVLAVPGAAYSLYLLGHHATVVGSSLHAAVAMVVIGGATVVPLAFFGFAARRISFATLGFIQFIAPSLVFLIGWLQGEPLGALRLASFAFIWAGVAVFAWGAWRAAKPAALP